MTRPTSAFRGYRWQRHFVPAFVVTAYHFSKSRALVSLSARVQWSAGISLGRGTVVKAYAVIQSSGGEIRFGRECAISAFAHVSTGAGDIIAGDYVRIAANATLVGGTREVRDRNVLIKDQPEHEPKGIRIGDDVLIGSGAVVLPGADIARGAVLGAGSVVSGSVPEYAIMGGVPATVIGYRQ